MSRSLPTQYDRQTLSIVSGDLDDIAIWERARWLAVVEINSTRACYRQTLPDSEREPIATRFETHPDRQVIEQWLEAVPPIDGTIKLHAGAESRVIYFLALHVLSEWKDIPKLTKSEHRKLYGSIAATVQTLRDQLKKTGDTYIRGGGHGLDGALVCNFFTDREAEQILAPLDAWNESHPIDFPDNEGPPITKPPWADFPSLDELLERVSSAANRLERAGPIHSQPHKRGAMNGYFIRRMDVLLRGRYGTYPADVLAVIATLALDVTVDADLVQKAVALPERSGKK